MSTSAISNGRLGLKSMVGIFSCLLGLGIIYFGFGVGTETPKKEANAGAKSPAAAASQPQRPVQAMNMALGNMVVLAHDLGFSIKTSKDTPFEGNKIVLRIESQLQRLRDLYRQESAKNPALVGNVLLQFNLSPSGEVSQVKEIASRINDAEFKKALVAEIGKWSFTDLVPETLTITCPLLFVREGMDITTLVLWEKSLANLTDKPAIAQTGTAATPVVQAKATAASRVTAATVVKSTPASAAKLDGNEVQIKYPTLLRKDPNFSATSLTTFTIGTRVTILNKSGDWLEVRSTPNGPTGFIRREFVKPLDVAAN
jgi:SH3 domain-containing protein